MATFVTAMDRKAYDVVKAFFDSNKQKVFYSRQVEVIHEAEFFHWITNRALRSLLEDGYLTSEVRNFSEGRQIVLYWHNSLRYFKRPANVLVAHVEQYAGSNVGRAIGSHGELLVLEGFASLGFRLLGRNTNKYNGTDWVQTNHDLDFIFERDGIVYGIEVKNTIGYIEREEYEIKLALCDHLGIKPVFVCRMLPATYIESIRQNGGFSLIMKYLLYPEYFKPLIKTMREELFLPVDSPKSIESGTMRRFEKWHEINVQKASK